MAGVSPVLQDPEAPRCHAVDAPVGDPVLVTDTDRKPPVVRPHHLDDRPLGTLEVQGVPLAGIGGLHGLTGSCKQISVKMDLYVFTRLAQPFFNALLAFMVIFMRFLRVGNL